MAIAVGNYDSAFTNINAGGTDIAFYRPIAYKAMAKDLAAQGKFGEATQLIRDELTSSTDRIEAMSAVAAEMVKAHRKKNQ